MSHRSPLTLGFAVAQFALYRSYLGAEGAEYEALEHCPCCWPDTGEPLKGLAVSPLAGRGLRLNGG